ncbi:MAG TPA: PAS domain-containing protein, partial [Candidatus Acidoferrum sp.]|nr:PAS domain-containing protein [Candidatus Acidoferrum sp.]
EDLLASIQDGFFEVDRDWRFTFINGRAADFTRMKPSELIGEIIWEKLPFLVGSGQEVLYRRVMETRQPESQELKALVLNLWFNLTVNPSANGITVYMQDITERKWAEMALQESEARFRILADSNPLIIWVTDAGGGLQFINRTYAEFFGVSLEQVTGGNWQPLVHPEDLPAYAQSFQSAFQAHTPFKAVARVRRADGEWRWIRSYAEARFSPTGEYLGHVGNTTDITESRQAREALLASEQLLATILASITDCLYTLDGEWRFTSLNDAALAYFQRPQEELLGRSYWEAFPQVVGTPIDQHLRQATLDLKPVHFEELSPVTGVWVEIHIYPSAEGLLVIFRDITTRRQMEAELRQSRDQLQMINEAAGVGTWSLDLATRKFTNDALTRDLLGLTEVVPEKVDFYEGLIHPEDLPRAKQVIYKMLQLPDRLET